MVRTLDFHSKNAGSNPASLIILKKFEKNISTKKIKFFNNFISIITPGQLPHLSFESCSIKNNNLKITSEINKLSIKQSYLMLTWFQYVRYHKPTNNRGKIKFFISKKKIKKFTNTKAPIAHKNWSKEQFQFDYYKFNISIHLTTKPIFFAKNSSVITYNSDDNNFFFSINQGVLVHLDFRKFNIQAETNLLNNKSVIVSVPLQDKIFFSYFSFQFFL